MGSNARQGHESGDLQTVERFGVCTQDVRDTRRGGFDSCHLRCRQHASSGSLHVGSTEDGVAMCKLGRSTPICTIRYSLHVRCTTTH